jgi:ABC-type branched-subunit amino acid transport system ATPase component
MPTVQALADTVYALDSGETIVRGTYEELARDPKVIAAYLGTDA